VTRFVNSVLIAVFAFFVFLALFWLVAGDSAQPPRQALQVRDVSPRWGRAGADGVEVKVDLGVHNPSISEARVLAVEYEVLMMDGVVAEGRRDLAQRVTPQGFATVPLTVRLPGGLAPAWWEAYTGAGEEGSFTVRGSVVGRIGNDVRSVPFEWGSSWDSSLAESVASAAENCGSVSGLCLEATSTSWQGSDLRLRLSLRNDGRATYIVDNATAALELAGVQVAVAEGFPSLFLQPGESGSLTLVLPADPQALQAWWAEHLRHCEWSGVRARLALGVQAETFDGPVREVAIWSFDAAPFLTQHMCHGDA
jgi:LEA14-like dessication related protein